jgi:hypothetical protein
MHDLSSPLVVQFNADGQVLVRFKHQDQPVQQIAQIEPEIVPMEIWPLSPAHVDTVSPSGCGF